jgi:hypothetical protein
MAIGGNPPHINLAEFYAHRLFARILRTGFYAHGFYAHLLNFKIAKVNFDKFGVILKV